MLIELYYLLSIENENEIGGSKTYHFPACETPVLTFSWCHDENLRDFQTLYRSAKHAILCYKNGRKLAQRRKVEAVNILCT